MSLLGRLLGLPYAIGAAYYRLVAWYYTERLRREENKS